MEILTNIADTTLNSFDFGYCISVNILTYVIVKLFDKHKTKCLSIWSKRIVFIISCIILGIVHYCSGSDIKLIVNSAILAPVSWSWIFKPICSKFNFDYKQFND